jgi:hypothetical protein
MLVRGQLSVTAEGTSFSVLAMHDRPPSQCFDCLLRTVVEVRAQSLPVRQEAKPRTERGIRFYFVMAESETETPNSDTT